MVLSGRLKQQPKILVYGECDRPGSGAWCYAETLRDLGHEVVAFSDCARRAGSVPSLTMRVLRRVTGNVLGIYQRVHVRKLLEVVYRNSPDILIVLKGLLIDVDTINLVRQQGTWVVNINHDDFFSQNPNNRSRTQRQALPGYDYIFTTREINAVEIRPFNPSVEFFPFAYYPKIHRPISVTGSEEDLWNNDVVFVGTYAAARARMLQILCERVPARYAIYGGSWNKLRGKSGLLKYLRPEVFCDDMAKAIGGAKIALGFLRKENRDDHTQRTFEIPACGGVLLAERTERHQKLFQEGIEAEFFDYQDSDELCTKVTRMLQSRRQREALRIAGREALLRQHHTYADRLERLLEVYSQTDRCWRS